jgi:nicotinamidase-related amidase
MTQALLVMDYQKGIVASLGDDPPALAKAAEAVAAARTGRIPIVFVRVGFRPGYPEINSHNKGFAPMPGYGSAFHETEDGTSLHPALSATESDIVVTKRRVGAFASDLSVVLSGLNVSELTLAGIATSGVVLSTVRAAADQDFQITVLSDACVDPDPQVQEMLMTKVFPEQAEVITVTEWAAKLS